MDWTIYALLALVVLIVVIVAFVGVASFVRRGREAHNQDGATPDPGLAQTVDTTGPAPAEDDDGDKT